MPLSSAIAHIADNDFSGFKGSFDVVVCTSEGWFRVEGYRDFDGSAFGFANALGGANIPYCYDRTAGADAVLKKLGEPGIKSYWMGVPGDYHIALYFDVSNFNKMTITAQRASNATRVCSVYYVKDAKFVNTGTSTGQIVDSGSLDISSYTTIGLAVGGSGTTTVNEYNFLFE